MQGFFVIRYNCDNRKGEPMSNIYNLLVPEDYTNQNGEEKTKFHQVGTALQNNNGESFTLFIPEGVSISGKVQMMPRKDREQA